jgi:protein-disulfide isomerase
MPGLKPPFNEKDHFRGNRSAPVQLLEYGDFQCPHCGAAHPVLKEIEKKYGSRFVFIFRHFPLTEVHPFARLAAVASEAAARQRKFWEMHDLIFENQDLLDREMLIRLARFLHMDPKSFQTDLEDPRLFETVESNFESGIISGVNGTPSFYINGDKYNGPYSFQSLTHALDQAMMVNP